MTKKNYEIEVLVNGKPVKEYSKEGRVYVEGRKGKEFSLRIRNNSNERILAIPSIDGLSVMNGKTASYDSSGYILKPYSSITVDGWRTSDKEVAKFFFSSPEDSYAEVRSQGENVGVIGVAVFGEKENDLDKIKQALEELKSKPNHQHSHCHWTYCYSCGTSHFTCQHCPVVKWSGWHGGGAGGGGVIGSLSNNSINSMSLNASNTAGSSDLKAYASVSASIAGGALEQTRAMSMKTVQQDLGTGWGGIKRSEVTKVDFQRKSSPEAVLEIQYNTREQLEELGIDFNSRTVYVAPQAFPNEYCEPPVR